MTIGPAKREPTENEGRNQSRAHSSLFEDLVTANRILVDQNILDAYGHISARDPGRPDRYWLSRSMAPSFVTADDIIEFDLDGAPIDGQEKKLFFERVIHGEIYKARPDVMAVVHSHSASLIPFCNSDTRLRPMTNGAAFLGTGAPVFEIRDVDEDGDLNVCNPAQGKALAQTLGSVGLVLMRGHGAVVVGDSVRQVVRRAVIAERNALQQIQAAVLGPVHFLRDVEIAHANSGRSKDPDRAWSLWARKVGRDENSPQGKPGPRS